MTQGRAVAKILTAAFLVALVAALTIPAGGCGKKKGEEGKAQETAQAQPPAEKPAEAATGEEAPGDQAAGAGQGGAVVKSGSRVTLQYRGTFSDGSVFDQSSPDRPFVFTAGIGQVIPGFDKAVLGMKLNEEKTVTIPAAEAYGLKNPKLIRNVARVNFPDDFKAEIGDEITLRSRTGRSLRGILAGTSDDSLLIDFNHPMAGKDLTFDLKVIGID